MIVVVENIQLVQPILEFMIEMAFNDAAFMARTCWYLAHYLHSEKYKTNASNFLRLLLFATNDDSSREETDCSLALLGTGCLIGMMLEKGAFVGENKCVLNELKTPLGCKPIEISTNIWQINWDSLYEGNAFASPTVPTVFDKFYCITRFVDALHKISNTLYLFPPHQRQQILVGELNLLNYNLPCKFVFPGLDSHVFNGHIVKIAANECVTLDSAERVPILIYLEVLEEQENIHYDGVENLSTKAQLKAVSTCKEIEHASIMLSQLAHMKNANTCPEEIDKIKSGILDEMNKNIQKLASNPSSPSSFFPIGSLVDDISCLEGFSSHALQEDWDQKVTRIKENSPWGTHPGWKLCSFIVKSNTDMRQEQLAMQLLSLFRDIFAEEGIPCWIFPYSVIVTPNGGLVQTVTNSLSLHSIKRLAMLRNPNNTTYSLFDWFKDTFGGQNSQEFLKAAFEFMRSLAAYSLFSYVFQLKDRHNGNILLDNRGHLVHVDFGFFLGNSPGRLVAFETAPFKLHQEWCDILDASNLYDDCKTLFYCGIIVIRKHSDRIRALLECMSEAELPCLASYNIQTILDGIEQRLWLSNPPENLRESVDKLFESSKYNSFTRIYDSYQYYAHGIL